MIKSVITLVLLIAICFHSKSQELVPDCIAEEFSCNLFVACDSLSQNELYKRASVVLVKLFNDAQKTIQINDQETAHIFAKGTYYLTWKSMGDYEMAVLFDLDFKAKEGRFKLEIIPRSLNWYVTGHGLQNQSVMEFCEKRTGKGARDMCREIFDNNATMLVSIAKDIVHYKKESDW